MKDYIWAALWRSENKLDGKREHLVHEKAVPAIFRTRKEARAFIETKYGYIRTRPDLQNEPHGWTVPVAIKVRVEMVLTPILTTAQAEALRREGQ